MNLVLLVVASAAVASFATLFLKLGSTKARFSLKGIGAMLLNWKLLLGIVLYVLSALLFITALRQGKLSVVYPLSSIGYIFVALLSVFILKERMTLGKVCGMGLIILGIVLVTL